MHARCVGLSINDKQCESIQVPFPHGDGDFQSQTGPERPLRPSPLCHHSKVMPREVNRLTWSHTEVGHPGWVSRLATGLPLCFVSSQAPEWVAADTGPALGLRVVVTGGSSCTELLLLLRPWLWWTFSPRFSLRGGLGSVRLYAFSSPPPGFWNHSCGCPSSSASPTPFSVQESRMAW